MSNKKHGKPKYSSAMIRSNVLLTAAHKAEAAAISAEVGRVHENHVGYGDGIQLLVDAAIEFRRDYGASLVSYLSNLPTSEDENAMLERE